MNTTYLEGQQTTNSAIAYDNNMGGYAMYTGDYSHE